MTGKSGKPRVLVLSFSNLGTDSRVHRQIALLAERFEVTAAGHAPPGVAGTRFCAVPADHWTATRKLVTAVQLKLGRFEQTYWSAPGVGAAWTALKDERFDLIIANDVSTLPLALRLRGNAKVLLDAHEYTPLEFEEHRRWRFFFREYNEYLCDRYLREADAMITVCDGIAAEYERHYGVRPSTVFNAPPYHDLSPGPTSTGSVRMVHHGVSVPARRIELMIESMDYLDERFQLDLMLMPGAPGYLEKLGRLAAGRPRVRIVPPVPMAELPRRLNQYDLGLYLLPPSSFNNRIALPNKFFEFLQARLAVAIGPSPEMARWVRHYDCGIVAADFSPRLLARKLNELDRERIDYFKQRAHLAARELCFEKSAPVLLDMVDRLIGSH